MATMSEGDVCSFYVQFNVMVDVGSFGQHRTVYPSRRREIVDVVGRTCWVRQLGDERLESEPV